MHRSCGRHVWDCFIVLSLCLEKNSNFVEKLCRNYCNNKNTLKLVLVSIKLFRCCRHGFSSSYFTKFNYFLYMWNFPWFIFYLLYYYWLHSVLFQTQFQISCPKKSKTKHPSNPHNQFPHRKLFVSVRPFVFLNSSMI